MQVIYSRVSTDKQDCNNQLSSLKELYPNAEIVEEIASSQKVRPKLTELLARLQRGDTLIIYALDRLGRRTTEVLAVIEDLDRRGVILKSQREGVDYSTIVGKLVTQILCSVAEMERNILSERIKSALNTKRKLGIIGGAPRTYGPETLVEILELKAQGLTHRQIHEVTGVSTGRISQLLTKHA